MFIFHTPAKETIAEFIMKRSNPHNSVFPVVRHSMYNYYYHTRNNYVVVIEVFIRINLLFRSGFK